MRSTGIARRNTRWFAAVVHGATPDITDGDLQEIRQATIGDMTLAHLDVIFADFHVFKLWGLDQEPAMLIGMDMLGVLDRLVIDYRRNEVSMYGDRSSSARHRPALSPAHLDSRRAPA